MFEEEEEEEEERGMSRRRGWAEEEKERGCRGRGWEVEEKKKNKNAMLFVVSRPRLSHTSVGNSVSYLQLQLSTQGSVLHRT